MHEDEGHYAGKHPEGTELNERAAAALKKRVHEGRISCNAAHEAAAAAGIKAEAVGRALDLMEVRINGCQLGLFGHKTDRGKADLSPREDAEQLRMAVKARADEDGISCLSLWEAAAEAGSPKIHAAAVCEAENIRVHSCQLGAF
ncbi:MAG: hypothetical protein JEZ04_06175 [Spirochaetales bacterium]|nr:hypothetical protein [Spirochaetales bacterium]